MIKNMSPKEETLDILWDTCNQLRGTIEEAQYKECKL